jgi:catechol 2,3-dioxygenase
MGSYIDPEKMIKARGVGMSLEELHKRGYAGEFPPEKEMDPAALM